MPFLPSPTPPPPRSNGDDDYDSVDDSDTACSGSVLAATTPQAVVDNNNVAVIIVIMDDNVTGWSFMVLLSMMMYVCRLCCLFVFSVCLVCCLFDWDVRLIWHFVKTNGRRQAQLFDRIGMTRHRRIDLNDAVDPLMHHDRHADHR